MSTITEVRLRVFHGGIPMGTITEVRLRQGVAWRDTHGYNY